MIFHPTASVHDGSHHYPVRVYYEDTDAGGVVYHANYLRFAERARTEALRDLGVPHAEMTSQYGLMFMVRRVKVDYLGPARLDDSLVVITQPLAIRAASTDLRQRFVRIGEAGRDLVSLEIQLACVRLSDQRPARVPARWRDALVRLRDAGAPEDGREVAPVGAQ
ncbi:tol-pal system-associated acyl-CoA thioesterase [Limobrevibacterium gyesilva]|uniref:Tol-pal system-associated acyl-CoA thioesterase n=1 Tax=Limobrevibacterium gyesilva TaxID=2991712 RepID=A0AA41YW01_9PROT|nr:tol-pal system-associated acyl-CoA thioesterase [Limobrevibacterium gyesilva]MCW3477415.1 tol-pal system-associated acyl-CoA thioesterase [Limobrevibacterium gyesilva]